MDAEPAATHPFKVCGSCRRTWASWEEFIGDAGIRLLGLQAMLGVPDASLLVFEHRCGTSVSVLTKRLRHLLAKDGSEAWPSLRFTEQCPGHCHSLPDHLQCDQHCMHARDRRLLALVEAQHRATRARPPAGAAHTR